MPGNEFPAVEAVWEAEEKRDKRWVENMLTDDFAGWPNSSPAPRSKESTKMWDRFADQLGESLAHELYPLSIVVHGDVAIAHYLYTNAYEDKLTPSSAILSIALFFIACTPIRASKVNASLVAFFNCLKQWRRRR